MIFLYSDTVEIEEMQFCAKLKVFKLLTYLSGLFLAGFHACLKL